jgi:hypothetical protein
MKKAKILFHRVMYKIWFKLYISPIRDIFNTNKNYLGNFAIYNFNSHLNTLKDLGFSWKEKK